MNQKDKAKELVDKFTLVGLQQRNEGIQCALIAVDEIIKNEYQLADKLLNIIQDNKIKLIISLPDKSYWESVKTEIEKL
jgi:hypothetical protein